MSAGWETVRTEAGQVCVVPLDDLIDHIEDDEDCACGPTSMPTEGPFDSIVFMLVHHSLDGRENHEPRT